MARDGLSSTESAFACPNGYRAERHYFHIGKGKREELRFWVLVPFRGVSVFPPLPASWLLIIEFGVD
jgi:hypothetical protein